MPPISAVRVLWIATVVVLMAWTVLRLVLGQWAWALGGVLGLLLVACLIVWSDR